MPDVQTGLRKSWGTWKMIACWISKRIPKISICALLIIERPLVVLVILNCGMCLKCVYMKPHIEICVLCCFKFCTQKERPPQFSSVKFKIKILNPQNISFLKMDFFVNSDTLPGSFVIANTGDSILNLWQPKKPLIPRNYKWFPKWKADMGKYCKNTLYVEINSVFGYTSCCNWFWIIDPVISHLFSSAECTWIKYIFLSISAYTVERWGLEICLFLILLLASEKISVYKCMYLLERYILVS